MSCFELTVAGLGNSSRDYHEAFRIIVFSSSIMSGGGLTLLSSNSATTLGGRRDPEPLTSSDSTSATFSLERLIQDSAVSTSSSAEAGLSRFKIVNIYQYLLSYQLGFPC